MVNERTPEEQAASSQPAEMPSSPDLHAAAVEGDPGRNPASPVVQSAAATQLAEAGSAAAPISKKDMTPEQRAVAIKAAQEKALKLKADRDAAKAAAAGGTAVATADAAAPVTTPAAAGPAWRIPAAGAQGVTVARPEGRAVAERQQEARPIQVMLRRRQALRGGVFAALGGFVILQVGSFLNLLNPRHITGFGGVVKVASANIPKPGDDPKKIFEGKFYLVNLKPGEGGHGSVPGSEKGGLVALYQKCVHLGCTVPWRPEFDFEGEKGWFRCPCHGSTYTKGGARVFGPAPRSLDTMDVTINGDGSATVNTGKITKGDTNDPQRGKLTA